VIRVLGGIFAGLLLATGSAAERSYPRGETPWVDDERVTALLEVLNGPSKDWNRLLELHLGGAYNEALAGVVIHIDRNQQVDSELFYDGRIVKELWGQQRLWVLIYAETDITPESADDVRLGMKSMLREGESPPAFFARCEPVIARETRTERLLGSMIRATTKVFFGEPIESKREDEQSGFTVNPVYLRPHGDAPPYRLYFAWSAFDLVPDSVNRVVVQAVAPAEFYEIHLTFGNFAKSRVGLGVAVGYTPELPDKDSFDLFLMGHLYLQRARKPVSSRASGLVFGTNLTRGDIFTDIVAGVRVAFPDPLGGSGLVVGANFFLKDPAEGIESKRTVGFLTALDYRI